MTSAALLGGAATADADEVIPTITMTDAGPDRSIPPDSSFYLSGDVAKNVEQVQAVVVRKSTGWLFDPADDESCLQYSARLQPKEADAGQPKPKQNLPFVAGVRTVKDVWATDLHEEALVTAAWKRVADGGEKQKFSVLVSHDGDFFRTGATYCVFVLKQTRTVKEDTTSLKAAAAKHVADYEACLDENERVAAPTPKRECKAALDTNAALGGQLKDLPAAEQARLRVAWADSETEWTTVHDARVAVEQMVRSWQAEAEFVRSIQLPAVMPVDAGMGSAIASLLYLNQSLIASVRPSPGGLDFHGPGGKPKVGSVSLGANEAILVHGADGKPEDQFVAKSKTSDIHIQGAGTPSALTLKDVIMLFQKKLRVHGTYVDIKDLTVQLSPLFAATLAPLSEKDAAEFNALQSRLTALSGYLARAAQKYRTSSATTGAKAPPAGTEASVEFEIGRFLATGGAPASLLLECSHKEHAKWFPRVASPSRCLTKDPNTPSKDEGWPGYGLSEPTSTGPLALLGRQLSRALTARKALEKVDATIRNVKLETTELAPAASTEVRYTQRSWVFSYLTPVVGAAVALSPSEDFAVPYVGVQLHFVPNPIADPMWANGLRDIARAFALEVGMLTGDGPWGEDDRYTAWSEVPAVVFGVGIHIIPYTTFTVGGMLLERRLTTIEEEAPEPTVSLFLGLNVQANLPDLARELTTPESDTQSAK